MFATSFNPAATIDATGTPTRTMFQRLKDWAWQTHKAIQMAQMLRALSHLNDAQLAMIGITRAEVPAHAHKIVYQNG